MGNAIKKGICGKPTSRNTPCKNTTPCYVHTKRATPHDGFTPRQRKFIDLYLGDCLFNAVRAAEGAGYTGSYSALGVTGHNLLKTPKIKREIELQLADYGMGKNETLARLSVLAAGSVTDVLDEDGNFSIEHARKTGSHYLLKKVKKKFTKKGTETEYEIHDKLAALDKIAKIHGLYGDRDKIVNNTNVVVTGDRFAQAIEMIMEKRPEMSRDEASAYISEFVSPHLGGMKLLTDGSQNETETK